MVDADRLQGTWTVVELEADGQVMPAATLAAARIVVRANRFTSLGMGATYEGTFELDATVTPKQMDMRFDSGPEQGTTNLAIYELDGDTWRLCLCTDPDRPRPTRFAAEPGSGCALETLQRTADADVTPAEPATSVAQPGAGPATELEGEWRMVSGHQDGQPMEARMVRIGRRVTRVDETTVLFGTWVYMRVRFTLDAERSPKAIDYVPVDGGEVQRGIYEVQGDTLRLCVSPPDGERPADFTTTRGDGRLLTFWTLAGR